MVRESNRRVLSCSTLMGEKIINPAGEKLGTLEDIVVDLESGRIAYGVLSFGGILGIGDKLFAIPWHSLMVDLDNRQIVLDVPKEKLERAPGFDKNNWPDMASEEFSTQVHSYYGVEPYRSESYSGHDVGEQERRSRSDYVEPPRSDVDRL